MKNSLQNKTQATHLRQYLLGFGCIGGMLLAAGPLAAQTTTPPLSVNTAATVMTPLSITSATTLSFGAFASSAAVGTVVIAPTGGAPRSVTGGVTAIGSNPGQFSTVGVTGTSGSSFGVNLPTSIALVASVGGQSMTITSFTSSLGTSNGIIGNGGTQQFQIGATLAVAANQALGTYTATFPLTLTYQ